MNTKYLITTFLLLILSYNTYPAGSSSEASAFAQFKNSLTVKNQYQMNCQMASYLPGREPVIRRYTIFMKGNKILLVTREPERDKGKMTLMVNDQLWQYFPRIEKTLNINTAMAVHGNVNITDIVSRSVFQFYKKTGYEYQKSDRTHIFWFTAIEKSAPYGKIRYFYRNGKIRYFEVYARSGIMLKKIYFIKFLKSDDGVLYPADIKVINALREGDYSLVRMSNMKKRNVPDYYFNPATLGKVRE
ncbi:MAG: outer membrane lipoprotein-sorting protein [Leptospirales bacterium]